VFSLVIFYLKMVAAKGRPRCGKERQSGSRSVLRMGSVNVDTMSGRAAEVVEMMDRRRLDFCCLQETRWQAGGTTVFEMMKDRKVKLFWSSRLHSL
jgi:hypothetical protein